MQVTNRKWLILSIAAVLFAGSAGSAFAGRANEITYFYYTDASHTAISGQMAYLCGSGTFMEGQASEYHTVVTIPCQDGAPVASAAGYVPTEFSTCYYAGYPGGVICK